MRHAQAPQSPRRDGRIRRGYGTTTRRMPGHSIRERVGAATTRAEIEALLAAAKATDMSAATRTKVERTARARIAALEEVS